MAINKELFGPQNDGEKEAFAIEALVFSVQVALQKAMNRNGVTNKQLAERLGMTPARVSQIFSTKGANLTLKTIARIQEALGEEFELISKQDIRRPVNTRRVQEFRLYVARGNSSVWKEQAPTNHNAKVERVAA
ncbi:helix-turn-helix domain-containing protein [Celeribacter ethanolicus]|uniref:helix-turn-helix domain-containing protein n=1 Tax=Celeribacter ethanolicus TaxID=1758178 RepID=UPI0008337864|nr:helix-turn-helix transcriptional regulator [Celeribacter ethanolicus]